MREGSVRANGLRFAYLEEGAGPLALLLHGFPDNAHTWERQLPALAEAGYRAVAPFLRGYPPTEIPAGGYYDTLTLAADARELIRELGGGEPAVVVGNDWGALAAYALMEAFPEVVRRACVTAIPHPAAAATLVLMPDLIHHFFHVWFHQVPGLPEAAVPANDFAYVEYLWRLWEPGYEDPEHLARVKRTLAAEGAVEAALAYYRAFFDPSRADPSMADVRARLGGRIEVPTLLVFGRDDPLARFAADHARVFAGEHRVELLAGGQHFLHRSRADAFNELLLGWIGSPG
jgi:pimeloyl-ACP methyl ester carboxylesterase